MRDLGRLLTTGGVAFLSLACTKLTAYWGMVSMSLIFSLKLLEQGRAGRRGRLVNCLTALSCIVTTFIQHHIYRALSQLYMVLAAEHDSDYGIVRPNRSAGCERQ